MIQLITFTDGGSRGNPGPAACGAVIKNETGKIILQVSKYIGKTTNNQAEYGALILALEKVLEIYKDKKKKIDLKCYLDSELVVKQLKKEYRMKNEGLKPLFYQVCDLILNFNSVKFFHIPREENKLADKLVNIELDKRG
ncbi:MAG: ribonuclease HI family protein [Candidatus Pacebacteria bacterium]|nr:ribonuclease HI family protein [Candidatus Paceibacterota bacterium]